MSTTQCPQGHFYDPATNKTCPFCANTAATVTFNNNSGFAPEGIGTTVPLNNAQPGVFAAQTIPSTTPISDFTVEDPGKTKPTEDTGSKDEYGEAIRPVCGWLVCIEGDRKGKAYEIYPGYTSVGRGYENDIVLDFDSTISEHAVSISYDYEENLFGIGIAKTKNIVKVNNKPLYNADKLVDGSVIKFGKSKFLFRALCNEDFKWEFNATEEN